MRIILHVDMDAFFTSIEQRENPSLKGKPVVVGADPKGGKGRGVVSTASYEARKYGIHSGQPIRIAYRKCPTAVFLPVNFPVYEQVSEQIMFILRAHADKFESAGLDEAYLDVSKRVKNFKEAQQLAHHLKEEILRKEKLTCSIGVAPNKVIAKIASGYKKPNGLTVILPEQVKKFLAPLPVETIPGIGPVGKRSLNEIGVISIRDLRKLSQKLLLGLFGKWGVRLWELARGIDESEVEEFREVKSVGREHTFEKDTRNKSLIYETLAALVKETSANLKAERLSGRTVTVKVRYEDFDTHTHQETVEEPVDGAMELFKISKKLISPFLEDERAVRLVGVRVSHF